MKLTEAKAAIRKVYSGTFCIESDAWSPTGKGRQDYAIFTVSLLFDDGNKCEQYAGKSLAEAVQRALEATKYPEPATLAEVEQHFVESDPIADQIERGGPGAALTAALESEQIALAEAEARRGYSRK